MSISPTDVIVYAYGAGAVFGVLFLLSLARTDFYRHSWGRNVAAYVGMLTALEGLGFVVSTFPSAATWPGLPWVVAALTVALSLVQGWRWWIQFTGNRRAWRERRRVEARTPVSADTPRPAPKVRED